MEWTRTDAARRWIVVVCLVVGPLLATLSVVVGLGVGGDSMRAQFAAMGANAQTILVQVLLETAGFTLVLAALAASTRALRLRGGVLGTIGAVMAVIGIVGFSMANASGLAVVALAQLPDQDAAFQTATAISAGGVIATAGMIAFVLEIVGQMGMLLIIGGLIRARLIPVWPLLVAVVAMGVNAIVGTMVATLIADVLLLVTCTWIAVRIARAPTAYFFSLPSVSPESAAMNAS